MTSRRLGATGAITTVLLVAAGCGGGSDTLSKADFVKQADAICASAKAKSSKLAPPSTVSQLKDYVKKGKAISSDEFAQLRKLKPPKSLQGTFNSAMDLNDKQLGLLDGFVKAASSHDQAKLKAAQRQAAAIKVQTSAKARKLGLSVCGSG